jgi:hypothetical protein
MKRTLTALLLVSLLGCMAPEGRALLDYRSQESDSRIHRAEFLRAFQAIAAIDILKTEEPGSLITLKEEVHQAQKIRVKKLEEINIQDAEIKRVHSHLLAAERRIYNGTLAFHASIQSEKMEEERFRANQSSLEVQVQNSEELFLKYEEELATLCTQRNVDCQL